MAAFCFTHLDRAFNQVASQIAAGAPLAGNAGAIDNGGNGCSRTSKFLGKEFFEERGH